MSKSLLGQLLGLALERATTLNPEAVRCYACMRDATTDIYIRGERTPACDVHAGDDPDYTGDVDDEEDDLGDTVDDADLEEAVDEYESFHWGNAADSVEPVELPDPPRTLVLIGDLEGVIYRTAKGGRKKESFIHFHDDAKPPKLAYDPKTGQMYILGGKYRITPHGIED